jgi:hypothetical protein
MKDMIYCDWEGVLPSLLSPKAFYFTTVAVEEFVEAILPPPEGGKHAYEGQT